MSLDSKKQKRLIKRISKGDQESFELFYNMEFEKIYRFISLKMGNKGDIEEISQDVFFQFWSYVRKDKDIYSGIGLLYKIARNKIVDYYRKNNIEIISIDEDNRELVDEKISNEQIEKELDIYFYISKIEVAMEKLNENYKDVIVMRYLREMTGKEISIAIGKNEGTVRVLLYRALKALKKIIKENE